MNIQMVFRTRRLFARKMFAFVIMLALVTMPLSATAKPAMQGCLPPPDWIVASAYCDGWVYIQWADVPGAEAYTIHILNDGTNYWQPIRGHSGTSIWVWVPCENGYPYRVKVKGTYPGCEGEYNQDYFWVFCC